MAPSAAHVHLATISAMVGAVNQPETSVLFVPKAARSGVARQPSLGLHFEALTARDVQILGASWWSLSIVLRRLGERWLAASAFQCWLTSSVRRRL